MIIDRIPIAGPRAQLLTSGGSPDIASASPAVARTLPMARGQQWDVSGILLLLEGKPDLRQHLENQGSPLLTVQMSKELFPALFADPFAHRTHRIGGHDDFKRGTLSNCEVLEVDGAATLVSLDGQGCRWISPLFAMPTVAVPPNGFSHVSWDLAATRKTPADAFTYSLAIEVFTASGSQILPLAQSADPSAPRYAEVDLFKVTAYRIIFEATVHGDAALHERHTPLPGRSIGRPLLRGVNVLERVESRLEIYSVTQLLQQAADYQLFEQNGGELWRIVLELPLHGTLMHSEYEDIGAERFEWIQVSVDTGSVAKAEARIIGEELIRPPKD